MKIAYGGRRFARLIYTLLSTNFRSRPQISFGSFLSSRAASDRAGYGTSFSIDYLSPITPTVNMPNTLIPISLHVK